MFRDTRRKTLRNRVIFMGLGVFIMSFGIWLNYRGEAPAEETTDVANNVSVEEKNAEQEEESASEDAWESDEMDKSMEKDDVNGEEEAEEGTDTESIPEAYLIKEVEGVVKVFFRTEDGEEELYLITSIPFELLSENDQQMLRQGVELETKEDLGRFLENFDS